MLQDQFIVGIKWTNSENLLKFIIVKGGTAVSRIPLCTPFMLHHLLNTFALDVPRLLLVYCLILYFCVPTFLNNSVMKVYFILYRSFYRHNCLIWKGKTKFLNWAIFLLRLNCNWARYFNVWSRIFLNKVSF